jgi:predicted adenylyl cyclase CyaB
METNFEIEVKLACDDLDRIRKAGFALELDRPRHFEDNWLLDSSDRKLLKQGAALRVRVVDGQGLITFKGSIREAANELLKVREEIESDTSEPERMIQLFERLGFHRAFRYQKYRTVYALVVEGQKIEVTYDELPIGNYIEIEGDEGRVTKVLEQAGFSAKEVIRESYPELQAARCEARGVPLEDLVFEIPGGK